MTVGKGQEWGRPGVLPPGAPVARTDAEAARILRQLTHHSGDGGAVVGLLGGDLARTCGAPGDADRLHGPDARHLPLDRGEALVDGELHHFVAHLLARHRCWHGRTVAVMNAEFLGGWDVAPRSHPNDGKLDLVEADLNWRDRIKARRRLPSGTHVPHPDITIRRIGSVQLDLDPGMRLWIDGAPVGPARNLSIRVVPDAWTAVI